MNEVTNIIDADPLDSHLGERSDGEQYLFSLVDGLRDEINQRGVNTEMLHQLLQELAIFSQICHQQTTPIPYNTWKQLCENYRALVHKKAYAFNQMALVSQPYSSMEELWSDAEAQELGNSSYTYWDTYEHGRRRQLESLLAKTYGSQSALLINSGMSSLAIVIGMLNMRSGDKILTGERSYFETSHFLEHYVVPRGVEIIRVRSHEPGAMLEALRAFAPTLVLTETSLNGPEVYAPCDVEQWSATSPQTMFLIDNSVQSHLTRWFDLLDGNSQNMLVMESAIKYLTQECMAGVIYGDEPLISKAREYARATGQQLQEKAFNFLCEAELQMVHHKLRQHARNVSIFCSELETFCRAFKFVRALDAQAVNGAQRLFAQGCGALVFLSLALPEDDSAGLEEGHRKLLSYWQQRAQTKGVDLPVRCGFGWNETAARAYESARLNQQDAPAFLRISVGIEPESTIRLLAKSLGEAAFDILETKVEPVG